MIRIEIVLHDEDDIIEIHNILACFKEMIGNAD